jgi:hypothetical protein
MRLVYASAFATAIALLLPTVPQAQQQDDPSRVIKDGGIKAPGWQGKVDAREAAKGLSTTSSRFAMKGNDIDIMTGPNTTYWNPANTATGDFTVKATFKDLKSDAGHPHAAGLFIGGSNLDSDTPNYTYCLAYTDGSYLVRQMVGPKATTLAKKAPNPAIKGPDAKGLVTNEIAWVVKGNRAECQINGTSVAGFDKPAVTTDGIYGIRANHNISTVVTGFGIAK